MKWCDYKRLYELSIEINSLKNGKVAARDNTYGKYKFGGTEDRIDKDRVLSFKKIERKECPNYTGISILMVSNKIYEVIIKRN